VFPPVFSNLLALTDVSRDLLVILDLASVGGEEVLGDLLVIRFPLMVEQGADHGGLVDVGHPHASLYEVQQCVELHPPS